MAKRQDEIITIEILNWEKFQHHNGKRTYEWFKMSAFILDDPEINSLDPRELKVWLKILTICAKFKQSNIKVSVKSVASECKVYSKWVQSCLTRLEQFQILKSHGGYHRIEEKRREKKRETLENTDQAVSDRRVSEA